MNVCTTCGLDFGSVAAFDRHRVGTHEYLFSEGAAMEPPRYDGRRCLDETEIEELVDKNGAPVFARNARGLWSIGKSVRGGKTVGEKLRGHV